MNYTNITTTWRRLGESRERSPQGWSHPFLQGMVVDWDLLACKEMNWGKHGRNLWSMNDLKSHFWVKDAVDAKGLLRFKGLVYKPREAKSKEGYVHLWKSLSLIWLETGRKHHAYNCTFKAHLPPSRSAMPTRQQLFSLAHHSCSSIVWLPWGYNL